jgi:hypothetical protein
VTNNIKVEIEEYDILFFMRGYNDIDHLTPVAYKLKQLNGNLNIACIVVAVDKDFMDDYRLNYLKSNGVDVYNIYDILKVSQYVIYSYITSKLKIELIYANQVLYRFINKLIFAPSEKWLLSKLNRKDSVKKFLQSFYKLPRLFIFDHSGLLFYINLISQLDKNNIPSVAIPHGHDIFSNEMMKNHMMSKVPGVREDVSTRAPFTYVTFAGKYFKDRYVDYGIVDKKQAIVIGSPRFSDEWVEKIRIIEPVIKLPKHDKGSLKIVLMLSKPAYNGFTDELMRTVEFIAQYKKIFLFIKPHTREKRFYTKKYKNVYVDNSHKYNSPLLIDWSDLVIFEHSCICFDALKVDKPTIYLSSTHANTLISESYFTSWEARTRDEVRGFILKALNNNLTRTYAKESAVEFMRDTIEPKGKDVLGDYANFLLGLFK